MTHVEIILLQILAPKFSRRGDTLTFDPDKVGMDKQKH